MDLIRLILIIILIIIILYIYLNNKNIENYNGYSKKRDENIYYTLKSFDDEPNLESPKKTFKLKNGVNVELGSDDYIMTKNKKEINIKNYIENKYTFNVIKKNIRDDIKHLYKKYENNYHNKSYGFL